MRQELKQIDTMLHKVMHADNEWLEMHHDWIQTAFPLYTPSCYHPGSVLLTRELLEAIKDDVWVVEQIHRALARMALYFKSTTHWAEQYNHNLLRITRILLSISYTLGSGKAHWFLRTILRRCEELGFRPETTTLNYWSCAANGLSYSVML